MERPPMWLWAVVIALGAGVAFADLRAEWQSYELSQLDALQARVTAAERRIADCVPRVLAEVPR